MTRLHLCFGCEGTGAMAAVETIAEAVRVALEQKYLLGAK